MKISPLILRRVSVGLLGTLFVIAGILHFIHTAVFVRIMPPWLPQALLLVYVSGVCEVIGGIGILIPAFRKLAGLGLIALLLAVFPANVHMALNHQEFSSIPAAFLWIRLPMQFVIIAWVWWSSCAGGQVSKDVKIGGD
jgi:uncharacterized membrane protein